jgi:hypothetical protein
MGQRHTEVAAAVRGLGRRDILQRVGDQVLLVRAVRSTVERRDLAAVGVKVPTTASTELPGPRIVIAKKPPLT